jgi:hypothetical protein
MQAERVNIDLEWKFRASGVIKVLVLGLCRLLEISFWSYIVMCCTT